MGPLITGDILVRGRLEAGSIPVMYNLLVFLVYYYQIYLIIV